MMMMMTTNLDPSSPSPKQSPHRKPLATSCAASVTTSHTNGSILSSEDKFYTPHSSFFPAMSDPETESIITPKTVSSTVSDINSLPPHRRPPKPDNIMPRPVDRPVTQSMHLVPAPIPERRPTSLTRRQYSNRYAGVNAISRALSTKAHTFAHVSEQYPLLVKTFSYTPLRQLLSSITRQKSISRSVIMSSGSSALSRLNAIKVKGGGIRAKIRRVLLRIKNWRFRCFTVLSKRKVRCKSSQRSCRARPSMLSPTDPIRGPRNVPPMPRIHKGFQLVANNDRMNPATPTDSCFQEAQRVACTRIAKYLKDQQERHRNNMRIKEQNSSVNYRGVSSNRMTYSLSTDELNLKPPPDFEELWALYLKLVLTKRIQIRLEIGMYQQFMQSRHQSFETPVLAAQVAEPKHPGSPVLETVMEASDDEGEEAFAKTFRNRRSVLGDMLEYASDNGLTLDTGSDSLSSYSSAQYLFHQRYATLSRKASMSPSCDNSSTRGPPLTRLIAIPFGLNTADQQENEK